METESDENDSPSLRCAIMDMLRMRPGRRNEDPVIAADTALFSGGLELDSVEFLETMLEIERRAGVTLCDETLSPSALTSVGSLVEHVLTRQSEQRHCDR